MSQDTVDKSENTPNTEKTEKPDKTAKREKKPRKAKPKKPPRIPKNIKVWCERTQKYYYKAKPEYYREYYHKNKTETVCPHCQAVITSQFSHHLATKKCTTIRKMKELESRVAELEEQTVETLETTGETLETAQTSDTRPEQTKPTGTL